MGIYRGGQSFNVPIKRLANGVGSEGAQFGFSVSGGTDLDNDGLKDIVVGAPNMLGSGRVLVFSSLSSDSQSRYVIASPSGSSRFGHSVVVLSDERLAVADASGQIQFIRLGADRMGGRNGQPDKIPDRCQIAPTPTPTPTPSVPGGSGDQAKLDDVYLRLVNTSAQLILVVPFEKSSGSAQEKSEMNLLLAGLADKANTSRSVVAANLPLFAGVSPKLTRAEFDELVKRVADVRKGYVDLLKPYKRGINARQKAKESATRLRAVRKARASLSAHISKLSGLLEPRVTPSIRSGHR